MQLQILGLQGSTSIELVAAATAKMSVTDAAAVLIKTGLTDAERVQILMSKGVSEAEAEQALATAASTAASAAAIPTTNGLTAATASLKSAVKGLWYTLLENPIILVGAAVIGFIGIIYKAAKSIEEAYDEIIDKSEEATNKINELSSSFKNDAKTVSELSERFAELAQNVDIKTGKNKGLSTEEYDEFLDISNKLAEVFPTLSRHYDENGNAIIQLSGDVDTVVSSLQNLLDVERQINNQRIADNIPDLYDGLLLKSSDYNSTKRTLEAKLNNLKSDYDIIQSGEVQSVIEKLLSGEKVIVDEESNLYNVIYNILSDLEIENTGYYEEGVAPGEILGVAFELSDADIQKVKNNYQVALNTIAEGYSEEINSTTSELKYVIAQNKENWSGLISSLYSYLQTKDSYNILSDGNQALVQDIVNGLDFSKLNFQTWDDAENFINNKILGLFSGENGEIFSTAAQELQNAINGFANNKISFDAYKTAVDNFRNKINSLNLNQAQKETLEIVFGIDFDTDSTNYDSTVAAVKDKLKDEYDDQVGSLPLGDLKIAYTILADNNSLTWDELLAKIDECKQASSEFVDFAAYQENVNSALESSKSSTGLTADEVTNLTSAYKDLDSFDASKLFEETANGIHLNKEELSRLNEELESNELQKYADEIKRIQEEIYLARANGEDASGLEADLADAQQLKLQYEALTSSYNKWLAAKSGANERDSYVGVGSSYEDMKAILDQGWYGDESLNAYLDLLLSADQRTGDALADFEKLNKTISGTSHSIMDYWQYDSDNNLVTDGLFDFLDDVNKKLGDSYATIDENGEYAFDFTGDKLQEVADAFGMSTEMVELFERAMIDAGMAVDMGDLTLVEQIEKVTEKLKEFQEAGKISDSLELDFDVDMDPLEDVKSSIDNLKSERLKIDADADPELAALFDDLIAKCEEQYYFRLNAETDGGLDTAVALIKEMRSLTATPLTVEAQIANEEKIAELAGQLAALPTEVQTAVGVKAENIGSVEGIISQLNSAPESITVPVNYTTGEYPETVEDATGVANYELGESPTEVPDATGVANFRLGSYPRSLPTINQYVRQVPLAQAAGTAHADGTTINAHANGNDWTLPRDEDALVNEIGTESLVRNGKWHLIPGGAHIEKLKRGDIIFSAKQTDELLKTGKVISGGGHGRVALAGGTLNAYDSGSGGNRRPGSASDYTSPSSTATNSTNTVDVDDELEKMDWIEVALDRIQRAIEKVKTTATSVYKSITTMLSASKDEISLITKEIGIQQSAYDRYMQEANSVGLSSDLANLVQTGAIDISQYEEETQELIKSYTEWFEKALDCDDAIQQLHEDLASLYEDNFNNIKDDFDNQLELLEHMTNAYENGIDMLEAQGYLQSTTYYAAMQDVERQNIAILNKELASLEKSFSEAMASGEIEEGSESWFAMQISINETKEAIDEANLSLAETAKTMREIEWEHFDYTHERIAQLTQESDFMIELMSNSDMHTDNGQLTNEGMATMGLHGLNYNTYMAEADAYAQEILEIDKQLAEDPYNTELIKRREELLELQQDSILAAEDEKQAIIDMVREGIELELESLKELIDTYTDALDSAKDLYDYQRKVEEQSENIGNIKKQLSAYENDLSEETRATVQKLTVELAKAEDELAETEWERQISEQKKMLDMLYEEYSLVLNERLDNTEALLEEMIGTVNANADSINTTLIEVTDGVGYTMTESMQSIWNGSTEALDGIISTYGDDFGEKMTAANNVLSQIEANTAAMVANSDEQAEETVEDTTPTTDHDPDVTAPTIHTEPEPSTPSEPAPQEKTITIGGKINAKGAKIYDYAGDKSGENQYFSKDPIYTVLDEKSGYLKVRHHKLSSGVTGWFKKSDVKAYKTGGLVDYTGLAQLDGTPGKPELVLNAQDTANFIALKETLQRMSEQGLSFGTTYGSDYAQQLSGIIDISKKIASIHDSTGTNAGVTIGDTQIEILIDHVEDYNDFVNKLRDDKKFEKMIHSMTIDRIVGGSPLAKNKYKW